MPEPEQNSSGGGVGSMLQTRYGPMAAWQWMLAIAGVAVVYWMLVGRQKAAATSTTTTADTVPSSDVPQFVIQNQLYPQMWPNTAPTMGAPAPEPVDASEPTPAPTPAPSAPSKSTPPTPMAKHPAAPKTKAKARATVKVQPYTTKSPAWASTISGIASHYGVRNWQTIWNSPLNAGLRAKRGVPQHIQPGDVVAVP